MVMICHAKGTRSGQIGKAVPEQQGIVHPLHMSLTVNAGNDGLPDRKQFVAAMDMVFVFELRAGGPHEPGRQRQDVVITCRYLYTGNLP
jgi:hypothetical protein